MVAMRRGSEGGEQHGMLSRLMNRMTLAYFSLFSKCQGITHTRDAGHVNKSRERADTIPTIY